jgi:hypothetical protein
VTSAVPARRRRRIVVLGAVVAMLGAAPSTVSAAEIPADPSNLGSVFASAQPGDTIVLAPGDYGMFRGAEKPGMVTLRVADPGTARMRFDFNPAANITLDGLVILGGGLNHVRTKNIVVRNSDVPGQIVLRTDALANANILLDHNVHRDWDMCDSCAGGRLSFLGKTSQPSGITVQNSEFRGGVSDGIASGANGLRIINNVFHDIVRNDQLHVDALQLIGSSNTLIKGNHFYNVPTPIMAPDGTDHEVIEDNVIAVNPDGQGYPYAISLGSDDSSVIQHNTFPDGACSFNARCGVVRVGAKPNDDRGRGTIIKDNVLGGILLDDDGSTIGQISHNVIANSSPPGVATLRGRPTFAGGPTPSSYAGFALAAGSLGKGTASDGLDAGIRLTAAAPPAAGGGGNGAGDGSGGGAAQPQRAKVRIRVLSSLRSIARTGRLRLRLRTADAGRVVLTARIRIRALRARGRKAPAKPIRLGGKAVRLRAADTRRVTLRLTRREKRRIRRARTVGLTVGAFTDRTRTQRLGTAKVRLRR